LLGLLNLVSVDCLAIACSLRSRLLIYTLAFGMLFLVSCLCGRTPELSRGSQPRITSSAVCMYLADKNGSSITIVLLGRGFVKSSSKYNGKVRFLQLAVRLIMLRTVCGWECQETATRGR